MKLSKDHLTPYSLVLSVRCDNSMLSVDVTNKTRPSAGDPTLTSHPQQRLLARSLLSQAGGVQQQHSPRYKVVSSVARSEI